MDTVESLDRQISPGGLNDARPPACLQRILELAPIERVLHQLYHWVFSFPILGLNFRGL